MSDATHLEVQGMVLDVTDGARSISPCIAQFQVECPVLTSWSTTESHQHRDALAVTRSTTETIPDHELGLTCVMFKAVISPSTNSAL